MIYGGAKAPPYAEYVSVKIKLIEYIFFFVILAFPCCGHILKWGCYGYFLGQIVFSGSLMLLRALVRTFRTPTWQYARECPSIGNPVKKRPQGRFFTGGVDI
jgi:hypothetical protein